MKTAPFRFYGSLVNLVTDRDRRRVYSFRGRPSVKNAVEAQGVPHPEVDLILVDGAAVDFGHPLADGERVSVYPYSRQAGTPCGALLPARPDPPRFVCDIHLGRLARSLRMLGLDVRYDTGADDPSLARVQTGFAAINRYRATAQQDLFNAYRMLEVYRRERGRDAVEVREMPNEA